MTLKEYKLLFTKSAFGDLKRLDRATRQRIVKKLEHYAGLENPFVFARKLTNPRFGQYRFRIGDFRVIFDVDSKKTVIVLIVLKVGHRKDVYEE